MLFLFAPAKTPGTAQAVASGDGEGVKVRDGSQADASHKQWSDCGISNTREKKIAESRMRMIQVVVSCDTVADVQCVYPYALLYCKTADTTREFPMTVYITPKETLFSHTSQTI